jgi:hypothetical protein
MIIAAVVRETILLIRWRDAGWELRESRRALSRSVCGMLVHPTLGHITHNGCAAIAHAPSGRVVAVTNTTEQARRLLCAREATCST